MSGLWTSLEDISLLLLLPAHCPNPYSPETSGTDLKFGDLSPPSSPKQSFWALS